MQLPQKRRFAQSRPGFLDVLVTTDYLSRRPKRPTLFESKEKPRTLSEQMKAKFATKLRQQNALTQGRRGFVEGVDKQRQIEQLSTRISGFAKQAEQARLTPEQEKKLRQYYLTRSRVKQL